MPMAIIETWMLRRMSLILARRGARARAGETRGENRPPAM